VLGGSQSLHTDAYDEAPALPTPDAALLALRQQQVLAEETGVANTIDPLGGSWFVESLTNETEREVWRYLDEIDRRGGMVPAVIDGYPQREIAEAAYRFQREFDLRERRIVGVNAYDHPIDDVAVVESPECLLLELEVVIHRQHGRGLVLLTHGRGLLFLGQKRACLFRQEN